MLEFLETKPDNILIRVRQGGKMCKNERINVLYGGIEHIVRSGERLREVLEHAQCISGKIGEEKVVPIEITNGKTVLEIFASANNIGGRKRNGGKCEISDFVRGTDEVVDFFKLSLVS